MWPYNDQKEHMNQEKRIYECTLIIRSNLSEDQAKTIARELYPIISSSNGSIVSSEYWGFKSLAYRIKKNTKAHYVCLVFESGNIKALYDALEFNQNVLRFLCIKRDTLPTGPSAQYVSSLDEQSDSGAQKNDGNEPASQKMNTDIEYKNIRLIKKHMTEHGKISPAHAGRVNRSQQKQIANAIKRARFLALLPYVVQ